MKKRLRREGKVEHRKHKSICPFKVSSVPPVFSISFWTSWSACCLTISNAIVIAAHPRASVRRLGVLPVPWLYFLTTYSITYDLVFPYGLAQGVLKEHNLLGSAGLRSGHIGTSSPTALGNVHWLFGSFPHPMKWIYFDLPSIGDGFIKSPIAWGKTQFRRQIPSTSVIKTNFYQWITPYHANLCQ